jgi:hypothetical protein
MKCVAALAQATRGVGVSYVLIRYDIQDLSGSRHHIRLTVTLIKS